MVVKVRWKQGLPNTDKADAQKVYAELSSLKRVTPSKIVEYAKDEDTELHKLFEWDDTKAAENWRKQQARMIVCSLVIDDQETPIKTATPIRVFYHNNYSKKYKDITCAITHPDEYAALLDRALGELCVFQKKYNALRELDAVMREIGLLFEN